MMERRRIADEASVADIRHAVLERLNRLSIDPQEVFDCLLAVTEACTNALRYGRRGEPATPAPRISWRLDESKALFSIEDFSSRGWTTPPVLPQPTAEQEADPTAGRVGGFGLQLMADLMDEVDLNIGAQGTSVTLVKVFSPTP